MEKLFGRLLTENEMKNAAGNLVSADKTEKIPAMISVSADRISCARCGSIFSKKSVQLPIKAYYCPTCIHLGRIHSDQFLYHLPQKAFPAKSYLRWQGKLSVQQQEISDALVAQIQEQPRLLVHAVTGAGKTEMIYALIDSVLKNGDCVGLASPRIDVCIELHKHLTRDFTCEIPLLHGGGAPYFRAPLVIATTHQLLRFRQAFALLIIDEVDAFPFVDNENLYFAVKNAVKTDGKLLYLTATSTENLDQQVKNGSLKKLALPSRYHGFPLVLPKLIWHSQFRKKFEKQRQTGFPLLIFVPEIEFGEKFTADLQKQFPHEKIAFVASTTPNRLDLVEKFRQNQLTVLVSSSILERGVTFAGIDVFIVKTEHANFTKSALIQMAGRVGRSKERPTGLVYFFHAGKTRAMINAVREIKKMNQLGGFQ